MPCIPVNMYIQSNSIIKMKYESILKKSYAISLFIQFCVKNNIKFTDFTETLLFKFSDELKNELDKKNPRKKARKNNATNYILKTTLYFMDFIGEKFLNTSDFCEKNLNVEKKESNLSINGTNKKIEVSGIYHRCFSPNDVTTKRSPISQKDIDKLFNSISQLSSSKHIQYRTNVLLKLLTITGARAGEISRLKIESIMKAYNQESPLLEMITLKGRSSLEKTRYVPVERVDLKEIITFIKIHRSKIIRKTIGKGNDHGYLFINEKTGQNILPITVSNEINKLKKLANIEFQTCAHMFRHRYITTFFIKLIKMYDLENKDDFRNALLDINSLKTYIQQATGHTDINSLDHYIDLAKEELTNIDTVIEKVNTTNKYEAIEREEKRLLKSLKNREISIDEYHKKILEIKEL